MERLKRVLAIHDISGVGKCSLTVALPIISAAGVECAALPTAILSTHTGGFEGYTFRDLTEDMPATAHHWKKEGIAFDAIYSGYLGSCKQIEIVEEIIDMFSAAGTLIMVDPVMADNGILYKHFNSAYVQSMAKLCSCADVIVPNRTEAAFMLGKEYKAGLMTQNEAEELLIALSELGAKKVVLTGVYFSEGELGCAYLDTISGHMDFLMGERVQGIYHGTGDVFASLLLGALMRSHTLGEAARIAVNYTCKAIELTVQDKTDPRMGVRFESILADYAALFCNKTP